MTATIESTNPPSLVQEQPKKCCTACAKPNFCALRMIACLAFTLSAAAALPPFVAAASVLTGVAINQKTDIGKGLFFGEKADATRDEFYRSGALWLLSRFIPQLAFLSLAHYGALAARVFIPLYASKSE